MADKPPYFPLYVQDFASSLTVEAMTVEAVGAYILLLCKAWHATPPASIPSDDETLSRLSRTGDRWSAVKASVLAAWEWRADGRLYQPRLEAEWRKFRELQKNRIEAGRKGGLSRQATLKQRLSNANAPPQHAGLTLTVDLGSESPGSEIPREPAREVFTTGELAAMSQAQGTVTAWLIEEMGFLSDSASKLARDAGATPERVRWLIDRVKRGEGASDPKRFVAAGIVKRWPVDNGPCPAAEGNSAKSKAAQVAARLREA